MKKILFIRQSAVLSNRKPSLGEFREIKQIRGLKKIGFSVTFVFSSFDHYSKKQRILNTCVEADTSVCLKTPGYSHNFSIMRLIDAWTFAIKLSILLLRKGHQFNRIIATYPTPEAVFICSIFKPKRTKLIVDVRDAWPTIAVYDGFLNRMFHAYCFALLRISARKIQHFICMSGAMQEFLLSNKIKGKSSIILNPATLKNDKKVFDNIYRKSTLSIFFAGTLNEQFDFTLVGELSKHLKAKNISHKIIIVGDGSQLQSLKCKYNKECFEFLGQVDKSEVDNFIMRADICFAFYKSKTFEGHITNKIIEYACFDKIIFHNLGEKFTLGEDFFEIGYNVLDVRTALNLIDRHLQGILKSNIDLRIFSDEKYMADELTKL
jgi:glycosyltransferase involved in cell wall biosynthesis